VVDIYETDDAIVIKADLPGVTKEGISIDVKDRVLTIRGERSDEKEVKEEKFYRKERVYGKFQRAFNLPDTVDAETIDASFKDGVLKVEVPKPEQAKPKQIAVH
jgi:HSP20 family protein